MANLPPNIRAAARRALDEAGRKAHAILRQKTVTNTPEMHRAVDKAIREARQRI